MADCASYIGCTIQDQESIDAYESIAKTLRVQQTPDEFMYIITTTMIFIPQLISLENLLYIIDDKHVRPDSLLNISGRELLGHQILIGKKLNKYPEAMISYYRKKYDLERSRDTYYPEDKELASTLWTLHHAMVLSYELRNYVAMINKIKYNHFKSSVRDNNNQHQQGGYGGGGGYSASDPNNQQGGYGGGGGYSASDPNNQQGGYGGYGGGGGSPNNDEDDDDDRKDDDDDDDGGDDEDDDGEDSDEFLF